MNISVEQLTPPGRGGIAVISVEGAAAWGHVGRFFVPLKENDAARGSVQLGHFVVDGEPLDEVLVAWTEAGAELHLHGGPVAVRAAMAALADGLTTEPAGDEPQPISRESIRRDVETLLPQADSLLVASVLTNQWSAGVSDLLEDPDATVEQLTSAADGFATVDALLNPPEIVLAGLPNAGKSTLMNHLVGRPVSIVHAQAGTTRDWVREKALFCGVPVWLTDTAGLWADADHPVDVESVRRAWQQIEQADVVILLSEDGCFELPDELHHPVILRARSKCDQASSDDPLAVSAQTGAGIDALQRAVLKAVGLADIDPRTPRAITQTQATALSTIA